MVISSGLSSPAPGVMTSSPPDFLTVEEAARVVRIGRTKAYDLARLFLATDGADGLPVVRFGKQLRVPRYQLEVCLGGPLSWPPVGDSPLAAAAQGDGGGGMRSRRTGRTDSEQTPRLFSV